MKKCSKCKTEKPKSEFGVLSSSKDGFRGVCRLCRSKYRLENAEKFNALSAKWRAENPEKSRESQINWRANNAEKLKSSYNKYYVNNKEKVKAKSVKYRANNIEKIKASEAERRKKNIEKISAYNKKYYAENIDKEKARHIKYNSENAAKVKELRAINREKNSVKINAARDKWNAANPERRKMHCQNRRAKKQAAGGKLSAGLSERLFILQGGKCPCCGKPLGDNYHLDHIMPIALGGKNEDNNIQLLRQKCNNQKHAKHPIEFMQSRGFLL